MSDRVLGGVEDLLLDGDLAETPVIQVRNNQAVTVHKINAYTIPYSGKYGQVGFVPIKSYFITNEERAKLQGIEDNANRYEHPTNHPITMIKVPTGNSGKIVKATGCCLTLTDLSWTEIVGKPTEFSPSSHAHSQYTTPLAVNQLIAGKSNIGHTHFLADMSGNISANKVDETCSRKFVTKDEKDKISLALTRADINVPNGVVGIDSTGKLPCSLFKNINIGKFVPVNTTAEMLAITHTCVDNNCVVAIRNDYTGAVGTYPMYALTALPATNPANWKGINVAASVSSVNGYTGVVELCTDDVDEGVTNLYCTEDRLYNFIKGMFTHNGVDCGLEFNDTTKKASMLCGFIKTPQIIFPANNTVDFRDTFRSSPFQNKDIYVGTHDESEWELYSDAMLVTKIDSYKGSSNLTSWFSNLLNTTPNANLYVRVRYISDKYLSDWSNVVCITTPAIMIQSPTLTVTANAMSMNVTSRLSGSPFVLVGAGAGITDTHISTDWKINKKSDGSLIWSSIDDTVNLTSVDVPYGHIQINTDYVISARYRGATYGI